MGILNIVTYIPLVGAVLLLFFPKDNGRAIRWGAAGREPAFLSVSACRRSVRSMASIIRMFFNDHGPPHFDARYGDFEATIDMGTLEVLQASYRAGR